MHWLRLLWAWLFSWGRASVPPALPPPGGWVHPLQAALTQARDEHHAGDPTAAERIREIADRMNADLTEGAMRCPSCSGAPTAIIQPNGIEIGCTACHGRRARAPNREAAVVAWNEGAYLTPRSI